MRLLSASMMRGAAIAFAIAVVPAAHAQQKFPSKPIRVITAFSAGSQADILARIIGQKITEHWGQQIVVDNRPSGGGIVASQAVLSANPDGHTLFFVTNGHAISASLYSKLPYDVLRDFSGVSQVSSAANVLVVSRDLGVKSVQELIALAKAKPHQINFASPGVGSGTHINCEMFKAAAALDVVHVAYKGAPEALNDVVANRTQFTFASPAATGPFIRDGRLIALAVSTKERSPALPNVPSVSEAAIPGFDFDQWFGVVASAKTPRAIINQLGAEFSRALALTDVKERMLSLGSVPHPSTPAEFDAFIRAEVQKFAKVVKVAGVRGD